MERDRGGHDWAKSLRTAATSSEVKGSMGTRPQGNLQRGCRAPARSTLSGSHSRATVPSVVSSWITPKARKGGISSIAGRGLHAIESIAADEVVAVKGGHVVTTETLRSLPDPLPNSEIQIADGLHLVALTEAEYEPVMLFINHSCTPNVGFGGNTLVVAMRDVSVGEELTTDYAMFDDYDGTMTCSCGTGSCRGTVNGRDWERPELQAKYEGYFAWHIQRKIARRHIP